MIRIREALDELPGEALQYLCDLRGLRSARRHDDRRKSLAHSYRGDHRAFVADLRVADLEIFLGATWHIGPRAYRLKKTRRTLGELRAVALALFTDEDMPAEMERVPEEDELDEEKLADLFGSVLAMLSTETLRQVAVCFDLDPTGSRWALGRSLREATDADLVAMMSRSLQRNDWNDLVEALGGARRKSFQDIAMELAVLAARPSDDEDEDDEPSQRSGVEPAAIIPVTAAVPEVRARSAAGRGSAHLPPVEGRTAAFVAPAVAAPSAGVAPQQSHGAPAALLHGAAASATFSLLTEEQGLLDAFADACAWADSISFVVPAVDTINGRGVAWACLARHLRKIARSYVGLDFLRTDHVALKVLYGSGTLRLLPAADTSVRAHVWVFSKASRMRVLSSAGTFGSPGLISPLVAATLWEGNGTDRFGLAAARLLQRAAAMAYVPDHGFAEGYRRTLEWARPHVDNVMTAAAGAFLRRVGVDAGGGDLRLVQDPATARAAMRTLRARFTEAAVAIEDQRIDGQGVLSTVYWVAGVSLWGLFRDADGGAYNSFGSRRPRDGGADLWTQVHLNVPYEASPDSGTALLAEDHAGACYLLCRVPEEAIADAATRALVQRLGGAFTFTPHGGSRLMRAVLVTRVDGALAVRDLAAFAHELARLRAASEEKT